MELRAYQQQTLTMLRKYLEALNAAQQRREQIKALELDISFEWTRDAWKRAGRHEHSYKVRKNGAGEEVPVVCLKVPTGGGKTLLAVKALDAINNMYRHKSTGLVLWIVPTQQIYRQTLQALKDKSHPYRQMLDMSSAGRTLILEKDSPFSPADLREQLAVMMLMLPAANRQNKETLRLFQDHGGFEGVFPAEDQWEAHADLLREIPNLDSYGNNSGFARIVKSSLGNTLRRLNPVIVLDEGHKAYSTTAQETLLGFNPAFILELSATPPTDSNILVNISGRQLLQEGMIKLDMHLHRQASADWRDTMRASHAHRLRLEQTAEEYRAEAGVYIRPIVLIQVERTGAKQRDAGFVHAEEVREFLIQKCNVPPEHIAVKSSERDELEQIDLLAEQCQIRYVITRYALQEGWDCPFAYILTVLTNPEATTSITQLVGRVLRQPYARKTNIPALDESYVYCHRDKAGDLLRAVRTGLESEGLGDMAGSVVAASDVPQKTGTVEVGVREQFKAFAGKVYLPCFVIRDENGELREVEYEIDILSRIKWSQIDLSAFKTLQPNTTGTQNSITRINIDTTLPMLEIAPAYDMKLDMVFFTRQILEEIPNPWVAYDIVNEVVGYLREDAKWDNAAITRNLGFVIEELRKELIKERKRLAKEVFLQLIASEQLRFYLVTGSAHSAFPERIRVAKNAVRLTTATGDQLQRSMFEYIDRQEFNDLERAVGLYLDQQYWVLAWYKNIIHGGYYIQGWDHRVFSDFIVLGHDLSDVLGDVQKISKVYVLETKGLHLKNEDTDYKRELFRLCNELSSPKPWDAIKEDFSNHNVQFQVVFEDEWERVLNAMLPPQG
jgi:type III restriction enzyme